MSRHYRIVHELENNVGRPYIVQGDSNSRNEWADVARFTTPDDAHRYITEVLTRHRALEEATRP